MKTSCLLITLLTAGTLVSSGFAAGPPKGSVTIDRIAEIKYPTDPTWSPDSKSVAFLWDWAGKQDLFVVRAGEQPRRLTDFPVNPAMLQSDIGRYEWASDDLIIFSKDGGLWGVSTAPNARPARFPGFDGAGAFTLSGDKQQIAFVRRGQIWIQNLKAHTERQLTHLEGRLRVGGLAFSSDGQYISFSTSQNDDVPEPLPYNGNRMQILRPFSWDARMGVVSVNVGDPIWLPTTGGGGGGRGGNQWVTGPTGLAILHQEISPDRKTREIKITTLTGETHTVWKDHDDAYWTPSRGAGTSASPDGKWITFVSDRSGWIQIYLMPSDATSEKQAKQITTGKMSAGWVNWSADSKHFAYAHSNEGALMERFISIADVPSGKTTPVMTRRGVSYDPILSPDGTAITFPHSAVDHPQEIYTIAAKAGATPQRLTSSLPNDLLPSDLTAPVEVHFPSRASDRKPVPGTLFVHRNLDKTKKHPAILWIHSDGPNENYLGWHTDSWRAYYAMHMYLAQQGYVILTADYRGSSGYGRDWAVGDYMDFGGKQTEDLAAGADYLKTLDYVDPDRIAVWGLSYGGYLTLQAMVTTPTLFKCAIDIAGVGDWATWNYGAYTVARMGTPVTNPDGYNKSAAVKHLDQLARPLMILQGTNDTNVPFWETLTVIDTLVKLGKPFDLGLYPGEPHYFRRAHILRDAWRRAEEFFDRNIGTP
jgi:Tol biopolymer transport system component/dienelactone hydrolase